MNGVVAIGLVLVFAISSAARADDGIAVSPGESHAAPPAAAAAPADPPPDDPCEPTVKDLNQYAPVLNINGEVTAENLDAIVKKYITGKTAPFKLLPSTVRDMQVNQNLVGLEALTEANLHSPLTDHYFFAGPNVAIPDLRKAMDKVVHFSSLGSGVIATSDGIIVTNHHVLKLFHNPDANRADEDSTTIEFAGSKVSLKGAKVLYDNNKYNPDIAIIQVPELKKLNVKPIVFAQDKPKVNEQTYLIGYPDALPVEVLSVNKVLDVNDKDIETAVVNFRSMPGNSGGPEVNLRGEWIGTLHRGGSPGVGPDVGFSVPIATIKALLKIVGATVP